MVHSSSGLPEPNTALNDARRHIKELKRRRKAMAYTREQWKQRINEAGSGRYEFVRWAVDGEFGALKKCVVRCLVDNYEWNTRVNSLINFGCGCPQCVSQRRWTADERIKQINKLENIVFVSWLDGYKNAYSKANVRCSVDNYVWSARVVNLVNDGSGCPQCGGVKRWAEEERIEQINSLENIEFISWADWYKGSRSKANVRCEVDGFEWSVSVSNLVSSGTGCPKCANGGYDPSKTGTLYALRSECGQYVKVGISNNPKRRHKGLERETPFKFHVIEQISGDGSRIAELEKHFHNKYERAGFKSFDGATEWLVCTPELVEELRGLGDK